MVSGDSMTDYDVYGEGPPLLLIVGPHLEGRCWFKQVATL
jgi:hypothetical protein